MSKKEFKLPVEDKKLLDVYQEVMRHVAHQQYLLSIFVGKKHAQSIPQFTLNMLHQVFKKHFSVEIPEEVFKEKLGEVGLMMKHATGPEKTQGLLEKFVNNGETERGIKDFLDDLRE